MLDASILQFMHGNSIATADDTMGHSSRAVESIQDLRSWGKTIGRGEIKIKLQDHKKKWHMQRRIVLGRSPARYSLLHDHSERVSNSNYLQNKKWHTKDKDHGDGAQYASSFTTIMTTVSLACYLSSRMYRGLISCVPLQLLSREMQPREGARISNVYRLTFSNIYNGKIWGTNPRPNMYVVYVVINELKLGIGSRLLSSIVKATCNIDIDIYIYIYIYIQLRGEFQMVPCLIKSCFHYFWWHFMVVDVIHNAMYCTHRASNK